MIWYDKIWFLDFFNLAQPAVPTEMKKYPMVTLQAKTLSNGTNFAKIGRWEPSICGRQRLGDKVKNIHI
jgi:hypothetical protein